MAVWGASSVAEVPVVRLGRWRVYEACDTKARHFAGHNLDRDTGRVSCAITAFEPALRRGRTESGRIYELVGEPSPEPDADAQYVWTVWCALNRLDAYVDVTREYALVPPSKPH